VTTRCKVEVLPGVNLGMLKCCSGKFSTLPVPVRSTRACLEGPKRCWTHSLDAMADCQYLTYDGGSKAELGASGFRLQASSFQKPPQLLV